ncbi:MAG: hypothetical protein U9R47_10865 [Actinomycetota bacterium]|nr:hypothetical protein [Actinomycetota bacterium]
MSQNSTVTRPPDDDEHCRCARHGHPHGEPLRIPVGRMSDRSSDTERHGRKQQRYRPRAGDGRQHKEKRAGEETDYRGADSDGQRLRLPPNPATANMDITTDTPMVKSPIETLDRRAGDAS